MTVIQKWTNFPHVVFEDANAAPNLTSLHLALYHPETLASIPTKSLSKVVLSSCLTPWSDISPFLQRYPSLISLALPILLPFASKSQITNSNFAVLPKLEVLRVESPGFGHMMATPNLKELYCFNAALAVRQTAPLPALNHLAMVGPSVTIMRNWEPAPPFSAISTLTFDSGDTVDHLLRILAFGFQGYYYHVPFAAELNLKSCSSRSISPTELCALALEVLDSRPELHLECDRGFFASSAISPIDRSMIYGTRIHERAPQ